MKTVSAKIPISEIYLDESIYLREKIDHKRIAVFELELNINSGFPRTGLPEDWEYPSRQYRVIYYKCHKWQKA